MNLLSKGRGENKPHRLVSNIILVGLCGSGKSAIGSQLARRLGFGFLDLDTWIEQSSQKSTREIFSENGQAYFRSQETQAIQDIHNICNHVIAVGGGAVASEENWQTLSQVGTSVWINCSVSMIAKRLLADPKELEARPLLADLVQETDKEIRYRKLITRLESLLADRRAWFEKAQFVVYESYAPPDDCARRLKRLLESKQATKILGKNKKPGSRENTHEEER